MTNHLTINIHLKKYTVGSIIKVDKTLYVVTCRIFPDVYELAPVHWNDYYQKYVGDGTYRMVAILTKKWKIVELLAEKEWRRVFSPSEGHMCRGYRIPYHSVIDEAHKVTDEYESDRRHKRTIDRTVCIDQERGQAS